MEVKWPDMSKRTAAPNPTQPEKASSSPSLSSSSSSSSPSSPSSSLGKLRLCLAWCLRRLSHIVTYRHILSYIATYCHISSHIVTYCHILSHAATYRHISPHIATYCHIKLAPGGPPNFQGLYIFHLVFCILIWVSIFSIFIS